MSIEQLEQQLMAINRKNRLISNQDVVSDEFQDKSTVDLNASTFNKLTVERNRPGKS